MSELDRQTIRELIFGAVADVTGHAAGELDEEMFMEADLGLDSIKMVELLDAVLPQLSEEQRDLLTDKVGTGELLEAQTLCELISAFAGNGAAPVQAAPAQAAPEPAAAAAFDEAREIVFAAVGSVAGHDVASLDAEMFLEADLGLDSIKMVELFDAVVPRLSEEQRELLDVKIATGELLEAQTLGELVTCFAQGACAATPEPAPATVEPAAAAAEPASTPAEVAEPVSLPTSPATGAQERIFGAVASITGHDVADLDVEMFLEADLGLDSIKMVELLDVLLRESSLEQQEWLTEKIGSGELLEVQTLGDLVRAAEDQLGHAAVEAPTPASAPVVPEEAPTVADVEVLHAQYPFLVSHQAVSTCSLCSRLRLRGDFDTALARQAWQRLIERHPMLRARFVVPEGASSFAEYRLEVLSHAPAPAVEESDLRELDADAREEALRDETHRNIAYEWPLDAWPLHRFSAVRLEDDVHELVLTNHHLISDGLGNQQLLREFMALYREVATGERAELPPATTLERYCEVVERVNAWDDPQEKEALEAYLRRQGKGRFFWKPEPAAGRPRAARAETRTHAYGLDAETTDALITATRNWRLPLNTMLVGALIRAIDALGSDGPSLVLNVPTSGRTYPGTDASHVVGCFAQNLALSFGAPEAGESWASLLGRVQQEIQSAIAAGYDRTQTRQAAIAARDHLQLSDGEIREPLATLIRNGIKSNVYLSFIGHTHIEKSYGPVEVEDYLAATVTNLGTLDTVVEIFDGCLRLTTNFDGQAYSDEFVSRLGDEFLGQLGALLDETPAQAGTQRAPAIAVDPLVEAEVRQVAEEVAGTAVREDDMDADLEADLGLDSLERVRIVTKLRSLREGVDPERVLACRNLREMAVVLGGDVGEAAGEAEGAEIPYLHIMEQCRRTPDAVAVHTAEGSLSYRELEEESNRLAHYLKAQGIGRGSLVGVMMHRGRNLMVATLGILKAGAAYVPFDPHYPEARIQYMIGHSEVAILLVERGMRERLGQLALGDLPLRTLVVLDEERPEGEWGVSEVIGRGALAGHPAADPELASEPDDLMVVLYTSGSTGTPKGVALAHRGYMNRFRWHQDLFQIQEGERVAQKTSICFDISVWEIFWPLLHGATVCPVEADTVKNPWAFAKWIEETRIHVMHFVPSLFGEFLSAVDLADHEFPELRWLVFSGEALPVPQVQRWMDAYGERVGMANLYGPTEASIDVSAHVVPQRPPETQERIPIGKAMDQVHLVVLDEKMNPLPQGEVGELWIGGIQLAHGYLNDPERTAAAFHPNPFDAIPGELLYKTGDLVVEMPDGQFDYRGRADTQIKIRGFRVELGEIESALNAQPGIDEAVALAVDTPDGQKRLLAWLSGQVVGARDLRAALAKRLPEYMVPHRFEWLQSLPKTDNGKLNRKLLAQWSRGEGEPENRVSEAPAAAAAQGRSAAGEAGSALGPAQRWLTSYFEPPYQWTGYTRFRYLRPLDLELFDRALNLVAERHPALRTVFHERDGQWLQRFEQPAEVISAELYDGTHMEADEREEAVRELMAQANDELRIDQWPLWRVIVVQEAEDRFDIVVVGHHMITDMLSNGVVFRDAWRAYAKLLAGEDPDLGAAPQSYGDYLAKTAELRAASGDEYVEYWSSRFPTPESAFEVPMDREEGQNVESSSASERFSLGRDETAALQKARRGFGCTLYTLMLAPIYRAMAEWSGRSQVVLSHRTHGRDLRSGGERIEGGSFLASVGNFAVNYPVGIETDPSDGWVDAVRRVKEAFETLPLGGVSFDLVGDRLPGHVYPDDRLTPVRVNYLGNRSTPESEVFEFTDLDQRYAPPTQRRTSMIEVFLSLADGELEVEIDYSQSFHDAETIRRVGSRTIELLRELARTPVEATPTATARRTNGKALTHRANGKPLARPANGKPLARRANGRPAATEARGPLAGKVAIVTGASRGIGRATATKLAEQGARVALVGRDAERLAELQAELDASGAESLAIQADVSDLQEVEAMVDRVAEHFGGVDILVNNAGITGLAALADSDPEQWRQILDVNLHGTYNCCRAVIPHLSKRGGGRIVNMGSDSSFIGYPLFSAYAASKHAVVGLTKALSEELKPEGIQVNAVCPAFVDTDMTPSALRKESIPTDQVADVVCFLASDQSQSITGESLNVFGKQDMYWYGSKKMKLLQGMADR